MHFDVGVVTTFPWTRSPCYPYRYAWHGTVLAKTEHNLPIPCCS